MSQDLVRRIENDIIKRRDLSLVYKTLKGNNYAFASLMKYYKVRVQRLGMGFFHNENDAEDFVQDVFIKVYTHLSSFEGKSMFSTWLMRIAYNTAINSIKSRKESSSIGDEHVLVDTMATPEEREIQEITKAAIREAVTELPEKYRKCVEMYFYYDISYLEISEITGFPLNTIKSHIFRAKKLLKEKLEDFYGK